jgi:rod shape determining protein RodA
LTALATRLPRPSGVPWRRVRTFDWVLLGSVLLAIAFGVAMIYSATQRTAAATAWDDLVIKQVVFAGLGLLLLGLITLTDYRVVLAFGFWIYVTMVATLLLVLAVGTMNLGSTRWFSAGFADLQPSEFSKVAVILFLAAYFERFDVRKLRHVLASLALTGVAVVLVLRQPNLSTAIMLCLIWTGMVFIAGIRPLHLSFLMVTATPALFALLRAGLIEDYMLDRVAIWLDPAADPLHAGFQNIQTLIAVANGGLFGKGYAVGPLAKGGWLVVLHTDNIFALVAEELGFIGASLCLTLLVFIVLRTFRAAGAAQDPAGRLVAGGVGVYILVQTAINAGVVLQLLPVTGVSLPFVSYGGSSLVALMIGVGLVQSVLVRRRALEFAG